MIMMMTLNSNVLFAIVLQVAAGLVLVAAVYLASLWLVQSRDIATQERQVSGSVNVLVVSGIAKDSALAHLSFDTVNVRAPTYVPMPLAVRACDAGAAFSMSLWMRIDSLPSQAAGGEQVVFVKGDDRVYEFGNPPRSDIMIKCPLLRLRSRPDSSFELVLEFNTLLDPDNRLVVRSGTKVGDFDLAEAISRWAMFTVVFANANRFDGAPNGVQARLHVNNILAGIKTVDHDALRWNNGDLTFFPQGVTEGTNITVADFRYFNRAITPRDIQNLYERRYSRKVWQPPVLPGSRDPHDVLHTELIR
jgi:hypothetical protein